MATNTTTFTVDANLQAELNRVLSEKAISVNVLVEQYAQSILIAGERNRFDAWWTSLTTDQRRTIWKTNNP